VAGALARSGADVVLLLRAGSLAGYPGRLSVKSVMLGDFEVEVRASPRLEQRVDVLWVATKATYLEDALTLAEPGVVGDSVVVPFLNGVDHVEILRRRYVNVVAGAIRVESERIAPGLIRQTSPFLRVDMAGADHVQEALRHAGIGCYRRDDEATLLWEKLVFLAPLALATTAFDAPLGAVRDDPAFVGCRGEALTASIAAGTNVEIDKIRRSHETAPAETQSSMHKDVRAGRQPEIVAIAGPIARLGREHGFSTSSTDALVSRIKRRLR